MKTLVDDKRNGNKLQYLCRVCDIPQGKSKTFTIGYDNDTNKIEIALFNIKGKFYAISNRCAHEGGPQFYSKISKWMDKTLLINKDGDDLFNSPNL